MLVRDGVVYPIDYANACPDVAVTSLHYYFPWAMAALLKWSAFCLRHRPRPRTHVDTGPWFAVADDPDLDYAAKLAEYQRARGRVLRDRALPGVLRARCRTSTRWCSTGCSRRSSTQMLARPSATTYPPHEHEQFLAHFRGLIDLWVDDETARLGA